MAAISASPTAQTRVYLTALFFENESLDRWIAVNAATIESQFGRRALPPHRVPDMPLTAAALEQITRPTAKPMVLAPC